MPYKYRILPPYTFGKFANGTPSSLVYFLQYRYAFNMARLFNEKHTQPLLYKEMVERTFSLKIQWFEPVRTMNCPIICIGKQDKALFLKLHFSCHPCKLEFIFSYMSPQLQPPKSKKQSVLVLQTRIQTHAVLFLPLPTQDHCNSNSNKNYS